MAESPAAPPPYTGHSWIGRERRAGTPVAVTSPWDGRVVGHMARVDGVALDEALDRAVAAAARHRLAPAHERAAALHAVARGLAADAEGFAALIGAEAGKPIRFARDEVARAVRTFTIAAEEATRLGGEVVPIDHDPRGVGYTCVARRVPCGVVAAITPFNFPLNLLAHKVAPALAAGNAVIAKPPPQAPLTAARLFGLLAESGLADDLASLLFLDTADAERLATDPRPAVLSFTGSDRVGWKLKALAGRKRVLLELGGNAAAIVHEDADLDWAATRCALGAFAYAGQVCISVQRVYVHAPVWDGFCARFLAATDALPVGDPADPATVIGPLIDDTAAARVESWVARACDAGATALRRGRRDGRVLGPTVLTGVDPAQPVACDEVFGPVVVLERYDDFAQAIARADASRFGLHGALFTNDLRRAAYAADHWRLGGLIVGDWPLLRIDNMPYGGVKDSGLGREGVRYAIEAMTDLQTIVTKTR